MRIKVLLRTLRCVNACLAFCRVCKFLSQLNPVYLSWREICQGRHRERDAGNSDYERHDVIIDGDQSRTRSPTQSKTWDIEKRHLLQWDIPLHTSSHIHIFKQSSKVRVVRTFLSPLQDNKRERWHRNSFWKLFCYCCSSENFVENAVVLKLFRHKKSRVKIFPSSLFSEESLFSNLFRSPFKLTIVLHSKMRTPLSMPPSLQRIICLSSTSFRVFRDHTMIFSKCIPRWSSSSCSLRHHSSEFLTLVFNCSLDVFFVIESTVRERKSLSLGIRVELATQRRTLNWTHELSVYPESSVIFFAWKDDKSIQRLKESETKEKMKKRTFKHSINSEMIFLTPWRTSSSCPGFNVNEYVSFDALFELINWEACDHKTSTKKRGHVFNICEIRHSLYEIPLWVGVKSL